MKGRDSRTENSPGSETGGCIPPSCRRIDFSVYPCQCRAGLLLEAFFLLNSKPFLLTL